MTWFTGQTLHLVDQSNSKMDHKWKEVPLGEWFENNWNSKGWLSLPYLKWKNKTRQFFLASRLKLLTRLSNDVNEETPGLIRSFKAQVQTFRVGMRPCTSCDSGAGIKLSVRPIFKALIFLCQMPEPLQTRLMERQWERGGGEKNTTAGKTGTASNRMRGQSLCLRGMANPWLYCGTGDVRDFSIKRQQCRGRLGTKVFFYNREMFSIKGGTARHGPLFGPARLTDLFSVMTVCSVFSVLCCVFFFLHGKKTLWVQFACESEKTENRPRRAADLERVGGYGANCATPSVSLSPQWCLSLRTWQTGDLKLKSCLSHHSSYLFVSRRVTPWTDESLISDYSIAPYVWERRSRHANKTWAMTVMSDFTHGHKM